MIKELKKKIILASLFFIFTPVFASAASLSISPPNGSYNVGDIITANIILDTQGKAVDGIDIRYLNYNPSLLEAQDDDPSAAGVQIASGNLIFSTITNITDTINGKISFHQITSGNNTFSGSGVLATARFKAKASGPANLLFDFSPGSTADTNVASGGGDVLTSVSGSSYQLNAVSQPPPSDFMLYLSPGKSSFYAGDIFPVDIMLNTKGRPIDGVDVVLSYNQAILEVMDKDAIKQGVQILADALMLNTPRNEAVNGSIYFAQTTSPGSTFSGSGVLATVYFRVKTTGTTQVSFSFTNGRTSDSNVSLAGADILDAVSNGEYIISSNNLPPVIYDIVPQGILGIVTGDRIKIEFKTNEGATCRYSANPYIVYDSMTGRFYSSGGTNHYTYLQSTSYKFGLNYFYIRCQDLSGQKNTLDTVAGFTVVQDNTPPLITNPAPSGTFFMPKNVHISVSVADEGGVSYCRYAPTPNIGFDSMKGYLYKRWTPSPDSNSTYSALIYARDLAIGQNNFYVKCKDRAGNVNINDAVISFYLLAPPSLKISFEGVALSNMGYMSVPVSLFLSGGTEKIFSSNLYPDKDGMLSLSIDNARGNNLVTAGYYDILVSSDKYIAKKLSNILLDGGAVIIFPALRAGDVNSDGVINSLDWSLLSEKWGSSFSGADVNKDRSVNSIDWGYLRKNWLLRSD